MTLYGRDGNRTSIAHGQPVERSVRAAQDDALAAALYLNISRTNGHRIRARGHNVTAQRYRSGMVRLSVVADCHCAVRCVRFSEPTKGYAVQARIRLAAYCNRV